MTTAEWAVYFYERANAAALDAMRFGRKPDGAGLARVRREDARGLRRLARKLAARA